MPGAFARFRPDGWRLIAFGVAVLVVVPLLVVFSSLLSPEEEIWAHLAEHVLPGLLLNTFWLVLGVAAGTVVLGVSLAWLAAVCEFPGRRFFAWAMLLPMALPAYVSAFVFVGLLDFTGPVQTWLREIFGANIWFPRIRSTGGVIAVMSLTLYPYVYLLAKNAFATQGKRALEAAQSLGHSRVSGFFRVALPMARPWIAGGMMLALMETLADFGTVSVFNYDTFTTAIYKAWFGLFSLSAASQLASLLIVIVFAVLLVEQLSRSRMRYTQAGKHAQDKDRIVLTRGAARLASVYCTLVLGVAFLIPVAQLALWSWQVFGQDFDSRYLEFLWHSLALSGIAALLTAACALLLAYAKRYHRDPWTAGAVRIATLGYALPGPVLAVGIFVALAWLDNFLAANLKEHLRIETGLLLQGTLLVMLPAYLVRFLAAGYHPVDSAMQRLTRSIDEASRSLGVGGMTMLRRVHLPVLRGGLLTGLVLVFMDVMKEMPITLMTRPFGWDTLAVRIFEMTSEGEWERAALPAVALVAAGLIPIFFVARHADIQR
ncbi:MAG: ABC transporter permease [Gallionellales bacterium RIFCSPLOWO2_12_FULL_59_22]|nr:MAG: ABC transporter permease [Gallionellales bacterium RIFCSPLOWO2_02_FULL_59_110]OGT03727.1 MAG: ABC transporter permease [Gallionellales bacterium RIFCSPLOWO2_02_58_13]OGT14227.1 MAG: ABC transporter permease [Gallionellales bacterium RIFCSPLOWO2_12_FULL_59_22]